MPLPERLFVGCLARELGTLGRAFSRAIPTDILHFPARVVVSPTDALNRPRGVERRVGTADDHSMPTTARPQQRYDHRLRNLVQRTGDVTIATDLGVPRSTAPWVARPGTEGRGEPGRDGPDGRGTPVRSLGAPTTREEAHRTPSAGTRSTSKLRIHVDARAFARRTPQHQDPERRGSCPRVCCVAGAPAVPAIVTESVPCLATAGARVCA